MISPNHNNSKSFENKELCILNFRILDSKYFVLFRWFTLLQRKIDSENYDCKSYSAIKIYDDLIFRFEEICIEDDILIGHVALKLKLTKKYFKPNNKKNASRSGRKRDRKRKREDASMETPTIFCIHKLGVGSFDQLSEAARNVRTKFANKFLPYIYQMAIIQFFLLFSVKFREEMKKVVMVNKIKCAIVSDRFNQMYGYHGPPNRGVAFVFYFKRKNGNLYSKHFCLGNRCDYGCTVEQFDA